MEALAIYSPIKKRRTLEEEGARNSLSSISEKVRALVPHLSIKESLHVEGRGLFTSRAFKKGEIVHKLKGSISYQPTQTSIHMGEGSHEGYHVEDAYGQYINHCFESSSDGNFSVTANVRVQDGCLVALRDIKEDEELMFDYTVSEIEISHPFRCGITGTCVFKERKRIEITV